MADGARDYFRNASTTARMSAFSVTPSKRTGRLSSPLRGAGVGIAQKSDRARSGSSPAPAPRAAQTSAANLKGLAVETTTAGVSSPV